MNLNKKEKIILRSWLNNPENIMLTPKLVALVVNFDRERLKEMAK